MVKECMAIVTNMTEAQSKKLSNILEIPDQDCLQSIEKSKTESIHTMEVIKSDLNPDNIVNIDGILLPIYEKSNVQKGILVPVKSTVNNLRSLALAVASGLFMFFFIIIFSFF